MNLFRSLCSRTATAAGIAVAIGLCSPGVADAVWFGAPDMDLPANVGFNCTGYPALGLYPTGATSCTWLTISRFGELNPLRSNIVPKGVGYITAFRIRTGQSAGQMRLTIFKSLRGVATGAETTCCIGEDQSPVVTPPANAVTTIPLARAIPVYNGPESRTIESFDSIAISLLDTRSTIPANYSSAYVTGAALYPSVQPGEERFGQPIVVNPYTGQLNLPTGALATHGYQVLLQAEWEPAAGVKAAASSIPVRNGVALVPIICKLGQTCAGTLRLQDVRPKGAIAAKAPATYGTATFKIAAGGKRSIKIKLSAAGRKLLARYRSRKVYANATLALGASRVVVSMRLTLRR